MPLFASRARALPAAVGILLGIAAALIWAFAPGSAPPHSARSDPNRPGSAVGPTPAAQGDARASAPATDRRVAEPVDLAPGRTTPQEAFVEFRVVTPAGVPVADCEVQVVESGRRVVAKTIAGDDGVARFRLLETGSRFRVRLGTAPSGFVAPVAQVLAERDAQPSGAHFAAALGMQTVHDIVLGVPAELLGMVVGSDGAALEGASVLLRCDDAAPGIFATAATGVDGMFRFEGIAAATYSIQFAAQGYPILYRSVAVPGGRLALNTTVLGGDGASVSGLVQSTDGRLLQGVEVWASHPDSNKRQQFAVTRTGDDGRFAFEGLPRRSVAIQAHPLGMLEPRDSPQRLTAHIDPQVVDLTASDAVDGMVFKGKRALFYVANIQVEGEAQRVRVHRIPRADNDPGQKVELYPKGRAKWIVDCPAEPLLLRVVYDDQADRAVERVIVPQADRIENVRLVMPK